MKKQLLTSVICILAFLTQAFGQANMQLSNLVSPTQINQNLLPGIDNSKNLGSTSFSWKNSYFDGDIYIDGNKFTYLPTTTSTFIGNTANSTSTGVGNSAFGYHVLRNNSSGDENSGFGAYALDGNTLGDDNAAFGYAALSSNTIGKSNCAMGSFSLYNNTSGNFNSAFGDNSLRNNTGGYNSAFGAQALYSNTTGYNNSANGFNALYANTSGFNNSANGFNALYSNTTGNYNTANGSYALYANTTGGSNTANGYFALNANITGANNTANGYYALSSNTTGGNNTANGYSSGSFSNNFSHCTLIGYDADQSGLPDLDNSTALGNTSRITASNQIRIGNSSVTSIGGYEPWTNISDGRYKKEIKENVPGIEFINKLKPVTYHLDISGIRKFLGEDLAGEEGKKGFKEKSAEEKALIEKGVKEKEQCIYTGFIAQDVEQAANEIGFDFSGVDKPQNESSLYGLRYAEFVVPLVKAVQELDNENKKLAEKLLLEKSKNDELEKRMEKLELLYSSQNSADEILNMKTVALTGARLEQNIPNPFEQNTIIKYFLPENSGSAEINIYSQRGELIKSIPIAEKGDGQILLNSGELAAGAYQYTLVLNGQVISTKQMIRTK